jgi:hypothetical protein
MSGTPPRSSGGMPRPAAGSPARRGNRRHDRRSPPPKPAGTAYDHRPAAGPAARRARLAPAQEVRVIVPDQPPPLTPAAARVLMRILLAAAGRDSSDSSDRQESAP